VRSQGENSWRLWCVSMLTIVAVLVTAGVASAAPAISSIASHEVQADQQAAGISSVQAQANLTIQHQATQVNLVGQLDEALGNKYAGVWFDDETGKFVVPVAVEGDARPSVEARSSLISAAVSASPSRLTPT